MSPGHINLLLAGDVSVPSEQGIEDRGQSGLGKLAPGLVDHSHHLHTTTHIYHGQPRRAAGGYPDREGETEGERGGREGGRKERGRGEVEKGEKHS